jgi:Putative peptidoglycan binding domain
VEICSKNFSARPSDSPQLTMKALATSLLIPALATVLLAGFPTTAAAKDKHHHRDSCRTSSRSIGIGSPYYGRSSYGSYSYSPHRYGSSYYASPYISTGYSSGYCAPRASIGFSLFSSPSYSYRSSRYYPSSDYRSSRASYSDDLAVDVQRALRRGGYYYGDIDGDIGPESRAAIREYQRDRGLPATGRIDSSLLRALRIS